VNLLFGLWAAVLVALGLVFVLWPLLVTPRPKKDPRMSKLEQEKATLQGLKAQGVLNEEQYREAGAKLAAQWLESDAAATTPPPRPAMALALTLLVAVPLVTALLYTAVGTSEALDPAARVAPATPAGAEANSHDLSLAAAQLSERMKQNPDDVEGWRLLGRTYRSLERFADARDALKQAYDRQPQDAEILSEYAEVMGLSASPPSLVGEPEKLLDAALAIDADNQRALFLKGYARQQQGDLQGALTRWERLLTLIPAGEAPPTLLAQIEQTRQQLGQSSTPATTPPASSPGTAASPGSTDTSEARVTVQVRLDPALAAKVQPDQTLFVFARAENGPPMPLAVTRLTASQLPATVTLTDAMGMVEGLKLSSFPRIVVGARISTTGRANASPGDLEGLSEGFALPRSEPVSVTIQTVRP
jgi:cytochrome c-type biogenesis protein CcmH